MHLDHTAQPTGLDIRRHRDNPDCRRFRWNIRWHGSVQGRRQPDRWTGRGCQRHRRASTHVHDGRRPQRHCRIQRRIRSLRIDIGAQGDQGPVRTHCDIGCSHRAREFGDQRASGLERNNLTDTDGWHGSVQGRIEQSRCAAAGYLRPGQADHLLHNSRTALDNCDLQRNNRICRLDVNSTDRRSRSSRFGDDNIRQPFRVGCDR